MDALGLTQLPNPSKLEVAVAGRARIAANVDSLCVYQVMDTNNTTDK